MARVALPSFARCFSIRSQAKDTCWSLVPGSFDNRPSLGPGARNNRLTIELHSREAPKVSTLGGRRDRGGQTFRELEQVRKNRLG